MGDMFAPIADSLLIAPLGLYRGWRPLRRVMSAIKYVHFIIPCSESTGVGWRLRLATTIYSNRN